MAQFQIKPEERDLYQEFRETMRDQLAPGNLLEETLVSEIIGASWRLRRCSAAEAELAAGTGQDPLLDERSERTLRSIERARAAAHSVLHRSINQLRRLQTDRLTRSPLQPEKEIEPELASNCKPAEVSPVIAAQPQRNAPCPCGSGQKYKRCCLRTGPGWPKAA